MEYRTLQGHRSNSTFYIVGSHCYLKNRQRDTLMYLRCHHYPQCAGSAKLSQTTQLVENIQVHTCGTTTEDYDYLTSSQSQIIRRMAVGSLHPSDLLQIVSIAEELGLMPSALIILIKEYYCLDKK